MQIMEMLARTGGLRSIAGELGLSEAQAASGASALLPAVLGGFKKSAQGQPGGVEGLAGVLTRLGGGDLLDDLLGPQPTNVGRGNEVLGQIFGSKDVSRTVAQNAAGQAGLDPTLLKRMLPMLAMLVAGSMAKERASGTGPATGPTGGGLGGALGKLLGGDRGQGGGGQRASGSGLTAMLDLDGDGNPLDDILKMVGKGMR